MGEEIYSIYAVFIDKHYFLGYNIKVKTNDVRFYILCLKISLFQLFL